MPPRSTGWCTFLFQLPPNSEVPSPQKRQMALSLEMNINTCHPNHKWTERGWRFNCELREDVWETLVMSSIPTRNLSNHFSSIILYVKDAFNPVFIRMLLRPKIRVTIDRLSTFYLQHNAMLSCVFTLQLHKPAIEHMMFCVITKLAIPCHA